MIHIAWSLTRVKRYLYRACIMRQDLKAQNQWHRCSNMRLICHQPFTAFTITRASANTQKHDIGGRMIEHDITADWWSPGHIGHYRDHTLPGSWSTKWSLPLSCSWCSAFVNCAMRGICVTFWGHCSESKAIYIYNIIYNIYIIYIYIIYIDNIYIYIYCRCFHLKFSTGSGSKMLQAPRSLSSVARRTPASACLWWCGRSSGSALVPFKSLQVTSRPAQEAYAPKIAWSRRTLLNQRSCNRCLEMFGFCFLDLSNLSHFGQGI